LCAIAESPAAAGAPGEALQVAREQLLGGRAATLGRSKVAVQEEPRWFRGGDDPLARRIPGSSSPETWVTTMGRTVACVDGDRACGGIIEVSSDLRCHVESDTQYVKGEVREVPQANPGKEEAIHLRGRWIWRQEQGHRFHEG
jgi:hypothetical protein